MFHKESVNLPLSWFFNSLIYRDKILCWVFLQRSCLILPPGSAHIRTRSEKRKEKGSMRVDKQTITIELAESTDKDECHTLQKAFFFPICCHPDVMVSEFLCLCSIREHKCTRMCRHTCSLRASSCLPAVHHSHYVPFPHDVIMLTFKAPSLILSCLWNIFSSAAMANRQQWQKSAWLLSINQQQQTVKT